jgi:predicted porin
MKQHTLLFLAITASGLASAQSSVALFGVVDATIAQGSGTVANKTQLTHSGTNTSRLGFRGSEDLGGAWTASFWLEAGIANDSGTGGGTNTNNQPSGAATALAGGQGITFNRRSTVSLGGPWGEVRLGRDYVPQYWNLFIDPFGSVGVGTSQTVTSIITGAAAVRASNSIAYLLPADLGGIFGHLMHYRGENPTNSATQGDGTGTGVRVGFSRGAVMVAAALGKTHYAAGDVTQNNIGGEWTLGDNKLVAHYGRDRNGSIKARGFLVGGNFAVGVGEIRASYSRYSTDAPGNPASRKIAVGYLHNLSRRTALYATFARVGNSGGAAAALNGAITAPNDASTGYDFGLRHSF